MGLEEWAEAGRVAMSWGPMAGQGREWVEGAKRGVEGKIAHVFRVTKSRLGSTGHERGRDGRHKKWAGPGRNGRLKGRGATCGFKPGDLFDQSRARERSGRGKPAFWERPAFSDHGILLGS